MTVRDPGDTYLSHKHKNPPQTDEEFISKYKEYLAEIEAYDDVFYFPLDTKDRQALLFRCAYFCDRRYNLDFEWEVYKASNRDRSKTVPPDIKQALSFAYEWYGSHK